MARRTRDKTGDAHAAHQGGVGADPSPGVPMPASPPRGRHGLSRPAQARALLLAARATDFVAPLLVRRSSVEDLAPSLALAQSVQHRYTASARLRAPVGWYGASADLWLGLLERYNLLSVKSDASSVGASRPATHRPLSSASYALLTHLARARHGTRQAGQQVSGHDGSVDLVDLPGPAASDDAALDLVMPGPDLARPARADASRPASSGAVRGDVAGPIPTSVAVLAAFLAGVGHDASVLVPGEPLTIASHEDWSDESDAAADEWDAVEPMPMPPAFPTVAAWMGRATPAGSTAGAPGFAGTEQAWPVPGYPPRTEMVAAASRAVLVPALPMLVREVANRVPLPVAAEYTGGVTDEEILTQRVTGSAAERGEGEAGSLPMAIGWAMPRFTSLPEVVKMVASVQRKSAAGAAGTASALTRVGAVQRAQHSSGHYLDHGTRDTMEAMLGGGFGGVRIHTDDAAAGAAAMVGADAFTIGGDIYFAHDAYRPDTPRGLALLGHELVHTVQQPHLAVPATGGLSGGPSDASTMVAAQSEPAHLEDQALHTEAALRHVFDSASIATRVVKGSTADALMFPSLLHRQAVSGRPWFDAATMRAESPSVAVRPLASLSPLYAGAGAGARAAMPAVMTARVDRSIPVVPHEVAAALDVSYPPIAGAATMLARTLSMDAQSMGGLLSESDASVAGIMGSGDASGPIFRTIESGLGSVIHPGTSAEAGGSGLVGDAQRPLSPVYRVGPAGLLSFSTAVAPSVPASTAASFVMQRAAAVDAVANELAAGSDGDSGNGPSGAGLAMPVMRVWDPGHVSTTPPQADAAGAYPGLAPMSGLQRTSEIAFHGFNESTPTVAPAFIPAGSGSVVWRSGAARPAGPPPVGGGTLWRQVGSVVAASDLVPGPDVSAGHALFPTVTGSMQRIPVGFIDGGSAGAGGGGLSSTYPTAAEGSEVGVGAWPVQRVAYPLDGPDRAVGFSTLERAMHSMVALDGAASGSFPIGAASSQQQQGSLNASVVRRAAWSPGSHAATGVPGGDLTRSGTRSPGVGLPATTARLSRWSTMGAAMSLPASETGDSSPVSSTSMPASWSGVLRSSLIDGGIHPLETTPLTLVARESAGTWTGHESGVAGVSAASMAAGFPSLERSLVAMPPTVQRAGWSAPQGAGSDLPSQQSYSDPPPMTLAIVQRAPMPSADGAAGWGATTAGGDTESGPGTGAGGDGTVYRATAADGGGAAAATEHAAGHAAGTDAAHGGANIDEVAERVLTLLKRQLALDHERIGGFLPDLLR